MSELAAAPAPAADDDPLKGEPTPESQQDVIRIFNGFKRDAQMIISKVSELEYELGEHELVVATARELTSDTSYDSGSVKHIELACKGRSPAGGTATLEYEAADEVVDRRQRPAVDGLWLWGAAAHQRSQKLREPPIK